MEVIIDAACGLDVHKETVVACIMGKEIKKETRTFKTMTNNLIELKNWLISNGITHVAMESTGVYWKPIFNILEDSFEILLVNARHIKRVPGRKTDVMDAEWICKCLRSGMLSGSFIPPLIIRELRDLTRYRRKMVNTITQEKNRVHKILEDANIKLSSVVSDLFGVSATQMIDELLEDKIPVEEIAALAKGTLKSKQAELREALNGNFTVHHKFMIQSSLEHINSIKQIIIKIDEEIDKVVKNFNEEFKLLQTIPGVKEKGAANIIAEIGLDMDRFPSEHHLSSWAGMSPGNNESAGKKKVVKQLMEINH